MQDNIGLGNAINLCAIRKDFSTDIVFHSYNVAHIAKKIAQELGLSSKEQEEVLTLSLLHDIGKCDTPSSILHKPGRLTPNEWEIMKLHAENSEKYFLETNGLYLNNLKKQYYGETLRAHHEKYGGGGYPDNLKGEEIPYMARIITIADIFEAITTPRVYRPTIIDNPLRVMDDEMGDSFDPYIYKNYARKIIKKYYNRIVNNRNG